MAETPNLLPREHGAYAQLGVALAAALALAPALRSAGQALVIGALFFASEPLLVLLGRRGEPARAAGRGPALVRLGRLGGLGLLGTATAWSGAPASYLWSLLAPALLGAALFGLFLARRERTGAGETVAAWAFAAAAGSVALLGGAGPRRATASLRAGPAGSTDRSGHPGAAVGPVHRPGLPAG